MTKKSLAQIGHPIVRSKAKRIVRLPYPAIQRLIHDMTLAMHHHNLVGIAAPQVGRGVQIFLSEIRTTAIRKKMKEHSSLRVYINPRIIKRSKKQTILYEGCGSLAHGQLFGPVRRPASVTVRALDEYGKSFTLTAHGLLAKVIQHEYDHLQGIICIDKFTDARLIKEREEYLKFKKK